MRVLVTGSTGHLGEAIMRTLLADHDDSNNNNSSSPRHEAIGLDVLASPYTKLVGSITDKRVCEEACRGIDVVMHTATLHKPHIATHSKHDFVDTNVTGTLNLLDAAVKNGVKVFIFTSTTSTFGDALRPGPDKPAVWVTEELTPLPKNIYGVTKTAAEDLCQLYWRNHGLPVLVLKTSRFFPEADDNRHVRASFSLLNAKANEMLYRRVDVQDVVSAHLLAMEKAPQIGFAKYIITATTPLTQHDLLDLRQNMHQVVQRLYPDEYEVLYQGKGWKMSAGIDRVYSNEKARRELGWEPYYDFQYVLDCLKANKEFRSPLALEIGVKGYHENCHEEFNDSAPYPVDLSPYHLDDPVIIQPTSKILDSPKRRNDDAT